RGYRMYQRKTQGRPAAGWKRGLRCCKAPAPQVCPYCISRCSSTHNSQSRCNQKRFPGCCRPTHRENRHTFQLLQSIAQTVHLPDRRAGFHN
ncbi:Mor transcription activator domain-containing protein, partial [Dysosmobacter welbionis]